MKFIKVKDLQGFTVNLNVNMILDIHQLCDTECCITVPVSYGEFGSMLVYYYDGSFEDLKRELDSTETRMIND